MIRMSKNLVVSFPGGKGTEIPLLYFVSKFYEDKGYEKKFISHPSEGNELYMLYENAKKALCDIDLSQYEDIVFVGKSLGTVVACKLKEELNIDASLVLLTPLADTLSYIRKDNKIILVAAGSTDRYLDSSILCKKCEEEDVLCHIEPDVGHRMEVKSDLNKNLNTIRNVIEKLYVKED